MQKVLEAATKKNKAILEVIDARFHKVNDYNSDKLIDKFSNLEFTTETFTKEKMEYKTMIGI